MQKTNILMILIDDLGWRDLTCYGSSFYETPNLDKLALEGIKFQNAYASCPVCSPTRASIMTGKYPARVGITQYIGGKSEGLLKDVPYLHYLPLEEKSIASSLKEGGYQTWHVGKWHLGDKEFFPNKHGFDCNIGGKDAGMPPSGYFSPYKIDTLEDGPEGEYLTDRLTDESIQLIEKRDKSKPFFLNLNHYAVHTPIQAPEELVKKYERKAKKLSLDETNPFVVGEAFSCEHKKSQNITRRILQSDVTYAAMIENLDTNIGRVLESLEKEDLVDETLVVFTSDNGGLATAEGSPTCNAPLSEGKGWNYEGGTRVCQIMKWPSKIKAGQTSTENVTSTDFYPTFLEVAGLPLNPAQHCDGVSLLDHVQKKSSLDREYLFWHYPHYSNQGGIPSASLVSGEWKCILNFESNEYELYDLNKDISESNDISSQHPELVKEFALALKNWQLEMGALIPERNENYVAPLKPKIPNNAHI